MSEKYVYIDSLEKAQDIPTRSERVFAVALLLSKPHIEIGWQPGEIEVEGVGVTYPDFFILNTLVAEPLGSYVEVTESSTDKRLGKRKNKQLNVLGNSELRYVFLDRIALEKFLHDTIENFDREFGKPQKTIQTTKPKAESRQSRFSGIGVDYRKKLR